MATLFQIRRGSGSVSLGDGELYLNKSLGSLQVSMGTTPITLARLDNPNSGSLNLAGNLTASNAYFSGDVAISGNLYLGNASTDNISALGQFTTNLVPNPNNGIDIGTPTAIWRTIYANTISASSFDGNLNGIDIVALSESVDNRLDYLQEFTTSTNTKFDNLATISGSLIETSSLNTTSISNINTFTASITGGIDKIAYFDTNKSLKSYVNSYLGSYTFGLGTSATSSYEPERLMVDNFNSFNIATFQTSKQDSYGQVNIKNFGSGSNSSTDLILWNDVATESSSYLDLGINSSNYSAGNVGYGGDAYLYNAHNDIYIGSVTTGSHGHLHLFGGNLWQSSSITVYADGTIGINTDKFDNDATTIPTTGYAMEISGGVLFKNNVDFEGNISASTISGLGDVSTFKTTMQAATASLNSFSASVTSSLESIYQTTASLNLYTQSVNSDLESIHQTTASLNSYTSSTDGRLDNLESKSASVDISVEKLNSYTSSLNNAIELTGSTVSFLGDIVVYGTQSILHSTNLEIGDNLIYLATASIADVDLGIVGHYNDGQNRHGGIFRDASDNGTWKVFKGITSEISGTIDTTDPSFEYADFKANEISASSLVGLGNITTYSTSVDSRLTNLQDFTASITGGINKVAYFDTNRSLKSYVNSYLGSQTFGLGTDATSSAAPERLMVDNSGVNSYNVATFQTSQQNSYAQLNIKNFGSGSSASTDLILWNDVATESSSYFDIGINSSNYSADEVGYAGDAYIYNATNDVYIGSVATGSNGHLHIFGGNKWKESAISVYEDGTIGINTDKFDNNATTIPTTGYAVEISGGVIFNNNIDVIGSISSSTIVGMGGVSQFVTSMQVSTASLNVASASLQSFSSSTLLRLSALETETGSLESRAIDLATITGSLIQTASLNTIAISNLNTETASLETKATEIGIVTASLISSASSFESRFATLTTETASLETRATEIGIVTSSLILSASSFESRFATLSIETGSLQSRFTTLATVTASIHTFTSSLNTYTGATEIRLDDLEYTASISVGAGLAGEFTKLNQFTASTNTRLDALEAFSSSYAQYFTFDGSKYHIDFNV